MLPWRTVLPHFSQIIIPLIVGNVMLWLWIDNLIQRNCLGLFHRGFWSLWMLGMALGLYWLLSQSAQLHTGTAAVFGAAVLYLWHMAVVPFFLFSLLSLALLELLFWVRKRFKPSPSPGVMEPSRRRFLRGLLIAPPALTVWGAGVSVAELSQLRIRRIEINLPELPPALDGFTIAHVSDLHVGCFTYRRILQQVAEATNQLEADLVVMTGDLINFSQQVLPEGIELMQKLKGRHGVYLCEGNHDLLEGIAEFRQKVKASGLKLLVDEGATLEHKGTPIRLIGTRWTDGLHGGKSPGESSGVYRKLVRDSIQSLKSEAPFHVVLTHHPHAWDAAREAGIDLTLSGHTHGGQLMLDSQHGFGPLLFRYWSGLYQRDSQFLVVSNGLGSWFPLRIHAPSEIIHLTLRRNSVG